MVKIVIGTTPTIKYKFSIVDPSDFSEAIMTIKDSRKTEKLRKKTITSNAGKTLSHIKSTYGSGTISTWIKDVQLELGSIATEYEPYTGQTFPISFGEAGTVYGGTLDVVSGELVVDRAGVDLGTLGWMYDGIIFYSTTPPLFGNNGNAKLNVAGEFNNVCEIYTNQAVTLNNPVNGRFYVTNSQAIPILRVSDDRFTDAAMFKSAVSGIKAVFMLLEPITYHLTPTEVRTLFGQNNVWADTGDSTVEYYCDTKRYIDKKISELVNS